MAKVSVIVPVYKVESYLYRCVDSILGQTFSDFDLILVDDGSPDACPIICDEYATKDNRVVVIHQKNSGLSAARNAGLNWAFKESDSQWITFIDSDDWIHQEYLNSLVNAAEKEKVAVSICEYIETFGEVPEIDTNTIETECWDTEEYFVRHNVNAVISCGKLYRKDCFDSIRFPSGKLHEDEFVTYKILFLYPQIVVIHSPLYYYYVNQEGITKSEWNIKRIDAYVALEEQIQYFNENGYEKAKRFVIRRYLQSITKKMKEMSKDRSVYQILCKKKWTYFIKYARQLDIKNDADAWVLTKIFPRSMKIYWVIQAMENKLNKIFKVRDNHKY